MAERSTLSRLDDALASLRRRIERAPKRSAAIAGAVLLGIVANLWFIGRIFKADRERRRRKRTRIVV